MYQEIRCPNSDSKRTLHETSLLKNIKVTKVQVQALIICICSQYWLQSKENIYPKDVSPYLVYRNHLLIVIIHLLVLQLEPKAFQPFIIHKIAEHYTLSPQFFLNVLSSTSFSVLTHVSGLESGISKNRSCYFHFEDRGQRNRRRELKVEELRSNERTEERRGKKREKKCWRNSCERSFQETKKRKKLIR